MSVLTDQSYIEHLRGEYLQAEADCDGRILRDALPLLEHRTETEVIELLLEDFELFCEACLTVVDKDTGDRIPLVLKPAQRLVARRILRKWHAGEPVRLIILKARREGVSTVIQAFLFWVCWSTPNRTATTVAHDDETTAKIFEMTEIFYEELEPNLRPDRDRAKTGAILRFANPSKNPDVKRDDPGLNSTLRTVSLKNAGTGSGSMLLHLSEVAKWKGEVGTTAMRAVMQIVPSAANTLIVWESTADGMDDHFEPAWTRAEDGESDFDPIFLPWSWEPTYVMPVPEGFERSPEEERIAEDHHLTDEQLVWRRWCIENNCEGSIDTFHQEYPLTPREAFLSSGRPYFQREKVDEHLRTAMPVAPWKTGQLGVRHSPSGKRYATLIPGKRGRVTVWEAPEKGKHYILALDPSEGSGSDPQAAYVLPREWPIRFAAAWHGRIDRFDLGDEMYLLGALYNYALIAVEITGGWGAVPISRLREKNYPHIYRKVIEDKRTKQRTEKLGWETNPYTRDLVLGALAEAVHKDIMEPRDPALYREMFKFIYNEKSGKPEAEGGAHDDRIMAAGVALHLHVTEPMPKQPRDDGMALTIDPVTGYPTA